MARTTQTTVTVFAVLALFIGGLGATFTFAYPEPALVTKAWEFKFAFDHPRPIAVKNLDGQFEWYWYVTYKVVNNTGQERLFIPDIVIATDQGDILAAGQKVPTSVFDAIKARVGNRLLESPTDVVGQILQGDDHAKDGVAIWPATKHNVDRVTVFVGGLSGETANVSVPDAANPAKKVDVLVTKTLMIQYEFPGAPIKPQDQPVVFKGKEWIMR